MKYTLCALPLLILACSGTETGNPYTGSFELYSLASSSESVEVGDFALAVDAIEVTEACDGSGRRIDVSDMAAENLVTNKAVAGFVFYPDDYCLLSMHLSNNESKPLTVSGSLSDGTKIQVSSSLEELSFQAEQPFSLSKFVPNMQVAFDRKQWFEGIDLGIAKRDSTGTILLSENINQDLLLVFEDNLRTSLRQVLKFSPAATRHYPGPCSISVVGEEPHVMDYVYDSEERLIEEKRSGTAPYQTFFEYDSQDRLVSEQRQITDPHERRYEYDTTGKLVLIEQTVTDPHVLRLAYDSEGRLSVVTREGSEPRYSYVRNYTYDDKGRLSFVKQQGYEVHSIEYTYDQHDRLIHEERTITDPDLRSYAYDAHDNLVRINQDLISPAVHLYSYACWETE